MAAAAVSSKVAINAAKLQTALQHSFKPLRRRRLGHIGPNHYSNELDKWGYKKNNHGAPSLAAGGRRIPAPRASLVLGGVNGSRRNNKVSETAASKSDNKYASHMNGNGMNGHFLNPKLSSAINGIRVNGESSTNGLKSNNYTSDSSSEGDEAKQTSSGYSSDLVVVLDMDECLIHSQFLSDQTHDKYRQSEERPPGNSAFHIAEEAESIIATSCKSFRISLPDGDLVHVNKRPNLDLFLKEITSKFETYIFTAAMEVYAAPLLNQLDPADEMFRGRFYRESCAYNPDLGVYAKDLCAVMHKRKMLINTSTNDDERQTNNGKPYLDENNRLHCDERRVVLVDNNPLSFLPNPSNGILVSSFYDDPKDDTLEAVMELLNELDDSDDVRPILDEKFGLKDALRDVVKESSGWR